jgi:hypothetical protein
VRQAHLAYDRRRRGSFFFPSPKEPNLLLIFYSRKKPNVESGPGAMTKIFGQGEIDRVSTNTFLCGCRRPNLRNISTRIGQLIRCTWSGVTEVDRGSHGEDQFG